MKIETLKDVVQWTAEVHKQLSHCLQHCSERHDSERAKMLLHYLAEHESQLAKTLVAFERTGNAKALNTWCYEYFQKSPFVHAKACEAPFEKLNTTEVMTIIAEQHDQLIDMYRQLLDQVEPAAVRELLNNLLELEQHEVMRLAQGANRLEDI